jgi:mannose-6-phosphate isomerase-like protein (cupin superfamily)
MHYGTGPGDYKSHFIVEKNWGYELWIVNNELYCGKILHINAGKKFSWHYHKIKDETFYIRKGRVKLLYGWDHDIERAIELVLGPDDSFHVEPGCVHQLIALEDSDVFEFSTHHMDEDSYRIIKGD